jgi:signal transduction histidine kinase
MNLIANAVDAVDAVQPGARITITGGAQDAAYVLCVIDNGPGIPAEHRERVFDPFFTTKEVGKGTGLGLSITYSIIKQHSGRLELASAEGGGTIAEVRLPLAGPPKG